MDECNWTHDTWRGWILDIHINNHARDFKREASDATKKNECNRCKNSKSVSWIHLNLRWFDKWARELPTHHTFEQPHALCNVVSSWTTPHYDNIVWSEEGRDDMEGLDDGVWNQARKVLEMRKRAVSSIQRNESNTWRSMDWKDKKNNVIRQFQASFWEL